MKNETAVMLLCLGLLLPTISGCGRLIPRLMPSLPVDEIFTDAKERDFGNAIVAGDLQTVKQMVMDGVDVNIRGKYDLTPLYLAIHFNQKEVFSYLLQQGADPWVTYRYEEMPTQKFYRRYSILGISVADTAINDPAPDYLLGMLKHDKTGKKENFVKKFFAWQSGVDRQKPLEGKEACRVDMIKLQAILDSGKQSPDDPQKWGSISSGISQKRYHCVLLILKKGGNLCTVSLRYILKDRNGFPGASQKWPKEAQDIYYGLDELCNYLESFDPEIFPKIEKALKEERFGIALQQLVDELDAKRGIVPE